MDAVSTTVTLTVRHFAAARAAAGVEEEKLQLTAGATVADALAALRAAHGPEFARVLDRCSFLLDEIAVRDRDKAVPVDAVLDVLPPFAGG